MRYVPDIVARFYERSPAWTRNVFSTSYGLLKRKREIDGHFREYLGSLLESQWWPLSKLQDLQQERLRQLIDHAAAHVPYYQRLFVDHGLVPSQIQTPDDLVKVPTLKKETVHRQGQELISDNVDIKRLRREMTSGTTGTPLAVLLDDKTFQYSRAVIALQQSWAGYADGEWVGVLTGYRVVPIDQREPPFWTKNYAGKQVHFSTYHLNQKHAGAYVQALRGNAVKYLRGYPSSVGLLAKFINSEHLGVVPMKGAFLGSEPIYDWQREEIAEAFGCRIYDYYGQTENVVMASGCGQTKNLHVNMEGCIVELVHLPDGECSLVGTSLVNLASPFIRYELRDMTAGFADERCPCGREHALMKPISTKLEDMIVTPEGNVVSASLLTFPFKTPRGVLSAQIHQTSLDNIVVKLVANELFTKDEQNMLENNIRLCVGRSMSIHCERVADIPRTSNGKFRFVISEVTNPLMA